MFPIPRIGPLLTEGNQESIAQGVPSRSPDCPYVKQKTTLTASSNQVTPITFFHKPSLYLRVDIFTGFSVCCKGLEARLNLSKESFHAGRFAHAIFPRCSLPPLR